MSLLIVSELASAALVGVLIAAYIKLSLNRTSYWEARDSTLFVRRRTAPDLEVPYSDMVAVRPVEWHETLIAASIRAENKSVGFHFVIERDGELTRNIFLTPEREQEFCAVIHEKLGSRFTQPRALSEA